MSTYGQQLRDIVHDYIESGDGPWPATARQIAAWAIRKKKWEPHSEKVIGQCADDIARAMLAHARPPGAPQWMGRRGRPVRFRLFGGQPVLAAPQTQNPSGGVMR